MERSSLKKLYTPSNHDEKNDSIRNDVFIGFALFLIGFALFPLGIALGMLNLEECKRRAYAAFLGVFTFLTMVISYVIIHWWDLLQSAKNAGLF